MQKLVDNLCTLLDEDKPELIDFEDLTGAYSRKKVNELDKQLRELQQQGYLSYTREEFGFRINVHDKQKLSQYQRTEQLE